MAYELSKKAIEQLSSTVPIDEAAVPSKTVRQELVATIDLTSVLLETFFDLNEGKQLYRDGKTNRLVHTIPPPPNEKRTVDVQFDKETGILTFIKADGSELLVSGLPTVKSLGKGPTGKKGKRGSAGSDGLDGKDGKKGYTGEQGPKGPDGLEGYAGEDGKPGVAGPVGPTGPRGPSGLEGPQGPQGRKGYTGARGESGCPGAPGAEGLAGPAPNGAVYISTDPPGGEVYIWGYPV